MTHHIHNYFNSQHIPGFSICFGCGQTKTVMGKEVIYKQPIKI